MKTALLIFVLGGLLAASAWMVASNWPTAQDAQFSVHMWIAMGLGAGLSLAVGGGLMALVFFSARKGYDDIESRDE